VATHATDTQTPCDLPCPGQRPIISRALLARADSPKFISRFRKREERTLRATQLRGLREKAERERQDQLQDRWAQKIADADRTKSLRKLEENAKIQKQMEKIVSV